jgi:ubiquinone/menaquinone biosynthesis C-methylase UbiE
MKKNMDYWESVLENLPESYHEWFKEEKKYLQKTITPDAKVLEIGCGDGRSIRDVLPITKDIIGIDHDDKAIKKAKKNFLDFPYIDFLKEDAANLSFSNKTFDFVICMGSFVNFADEKYKILGEAKRVLKDNGRIIISVFSEDAMEERMKVYSSIGVKIKDIKNGRVIFDDISDDNISEQFTKEQLENIFSKSNLKIKDITKVNIAYLCTLSKQP